MKAILILLTILIAVTAVVFGPIIAMWCVGVLFGYTIPLTLKTWFAMLLVLGMVGGTKYHSSK